MEITVYKRLHWTELYLRTKTSNKTQKNTFWTHSDLII